MRQFIKSFFDGLSEAISYQEKFHDNVVKSTEEIIEKLKNVLFVSLIGISLMVTGIFLISWGISSVIETALDKKGLGYLVTGLFVMLIGIILSNNIKKKMERKSEK